MCTVDTNAAGNGNLEVTVTNPAGSTIYNYVRPIGTTMFGVFFTPTQSGMHLINVSFNSEVVCGLYWSDVVQPCSCTFDPVSRRRCQCLNVFVCVFLRICLSVLCVYRSHIQLEETSTHKIAKTHAGNVFVHRNLDL